MSRDSIDLDIAAPPAVLDPRFPLARREIIALMETLLATLGLSAAHLSLTLVDDAGIAELNARHLGCQGPTNILSFPEAAPARPDEPRELREPRELGALFLSVETLAREAFLYGQDPCLHLARLLTHGILHLAGHDHGPEMDALTDMAVDVAESVHGTGGCGGACCSCDSDW